MQFYLDILTFFVNLTFLAIWDNNNNMKKKDYFIIYFDKKMTNLYGL